MLAREILGGGGRGALLLEALTAEHRASLRRLEGDGRLFAACRAAGLGLDLVVAAVAARSYLGRTFAFAGFAAFGFVLELFVVEEKLFAGGKNEIGPTINTLEGPILKFHLSRTSTPGAPFWSLSASAERRGSAACCWCYFPRFGPPSRLSGRLQIETCPPGGEAGGAAGRHGRVAAHRIN